MSKVTARRVLKKLGFVLELNEHQAGWVEEILTMGSSEQREDQSRLTPAELDVVRNLSSWYSYEYHGAEDNPVFLAVNLNAGRSLVISERKLNGGDLSPDLSSDSLALSSEDSTVSETVQPGPSETTDPRAVKWSLIPYDWEKEAQILRDALSLFLSQRSIRELSQLRGFTPQQRRRVLERFLDRVPPL